MNNIERRDSEMLYISDDSVFEQQKRARRLTQKLNTMDRSDFEGISAVVKELLGKSEGAFINPPSTVTTASTLKSARICSVITTAPLLTWAK